MKREEAIKLLVNATYSDEWQGNEDLTTAHNMAIEALKNERPTGKWIMHIDNLFPEDSSQECNKCHEHQQLLGDDNYCPNCGAKMIGIETDYVLVKEVK